jgi:hypothetical protein
VRPRSPIAVAKKQPIWIVPAAAAILFAGALAIVLIGRRPTNHAVTVASVVPVPKPSASAEHGETTLFANPARVDASDLYPRVKARALAWNADARLVSITAMPVLGDKVDLTKDNAEIVYVFGVDLSARAQPLGHLAVTVRQSGMDQALWSGALKTGPASGRTPLNVVEPNCVFDAAARAAHASGVPAATAMKLRYEADGTPRKGVWTARVPGHAELDRVIDGQTCAVVVRR